MSSSCFSLVIFRSSSSFVSFTSSVYQFSHRRGTWGCTVDQACLWICDLLWFSGLLLQSLICGAHFLRVKLCYKQKDKIGFLRITNRQFEKFAQLSTVIQLFFAMYLLAAFVSNTIISLSRIWKEQLFVALKPHISKPRHRESPKFFFFMCRNFFSFPLQLAALFSSLSFFFFLDGTLLHTI